MPQCLNLRLAIALALNEATEHPDQAHDVLELGSGWRPTTVPGSAAASKVARI
jgi:hypothetical protein